MAAPSRLGNLTFSYHKETNESLKRLRKPKSLAASSRIFDSGSSKFSRSSADVERAGDNSQSGKNVSHGMESITTGLSSGTYKTTPEKTYGRNNTTSRGNYNSTEKPYDNDQSSTRENLKRNYSTEVYGENITPRRNSTEIHGDDETHSSAYDAYLDKLLEGSKETKFYPAPMSSNKHERNNTAPLLPYESGSEKYNNNNNSDCETTPITYGNESRENIMSSDDFFSSSQSTFSNDQTMDAIYPLNDDNVDAIPPFQDGESREDSTASLPSTKEILRSPPRSSLASPNSSFSGKTNKTSIGRSVSFSIPERRSFDADDSKEDETQYGRPTSPVVATVTRSNSKRLINDENNLKSLFDMARDESKENLRTRQQTQKLSNREHEVDGNLEENIEEGGEQNEQDFHRQIEDDNDLKRILPKTVRRLTFNKGDDIKDRVVQSFSRDIDSIRDSPPHVIDVSSISNSETNSFSIDYRSPSKDASSKYKALANRSYKKDNTMTLDYRSPSTGSMHETNNFELEENSRQTTLTDR